MLKHYNAVPVFVLAGVLALTFADIPLLIPMFQARVNPALDPAAQGKREKDARLHSLRHAETVNMVAFGLSTFALLILMGLIAHIYKFTRNLEADSVVVRRFYIFDQSCPSGADCLPSGPERSDLRNNLPYPKSYLRCCLGVQRRRA